MKFAAAGFFRKYRRGLLIAICAALVSVGVYGLVTVLFPIQTIEVASGDIQVEVEEARIPKNLLFFPSEKIRQDLLADNPLLADITFKKKFPHTLVIIPHLRTPLVRVYGQDRRVLVDRDGVVMGDDDGYGSLPIVDIPAVGLRIGGTIHDSRVLAAISFVSRVSEFVAIEQVTLVEDRYLQAKTDTYTILFTQDTPTVALSATLQTLILGFRIKGSLPAVIDLRFNKPVVRF